MLQRILRRPREPRRPMPEIRPIDAVLDELKSVQQTSERQWSARCPGHNDTSPSLSVNETGTGDVLLYCHAGCTVEKIVAALGLEMADLFNHTSTIGFAKERNERRSANATPPKVTKQPSAHPSEGTQPKQLALKTAAGAANDWAALTRKYEKALSEKKLKGLANHLGLTPESLRKLHVGWWTKSSEGGSYTFPEFNGRSEIVGISVRLTDSQKRFIKGGKRGLYLPEGWKTCIGPILIVEGATDTAALASMRLAGIGRPSAKGGAEYLAELLADVGTDREIFVVGELDTKPDGSWPGRDGAERVANELAGRLGRSVKCVLPPNNTKDIRSWLGGQLESQEQ